MPTGRGGEGPMASTKIGTADSLQYMPECFVIDMFLKLLPCFYSYRKVW